jgi:signal transduction histidine kinase
MRERAEEVGGSLSLQSRAGKGTELVVRVPTKGNNHA